MNELLKKQLITTGTFSITLENILSVIIILFAAYFILKIVSILITRSFQKKSGHDGRRLSIIQLVKYVVWILAIILILQALSINITFFLASSAALLVGIGLGLQNVFKDFISGIILLIEGTIKVDDIVEVDGMVVKVKEISLRTSKVTSREEIDMIIPNHKIIENNVINWSHSSLPTRFLIEVGIDYSADVNVVENVLIECANNDPDVIKDDTYKPNVRLKDFGESSLDFQLFFYSYNLFRIESTKSRLRLKILEAFRENKITFSYPQQVIRYANKE